MIAVFLNNKLISADTIVPFLLAVKKAQPQRRIRFYCFDWATHEALRRNVVLWDAIHAMGDLTSLQVDPALPLARPRSKLLKLRVLAGLLLASWIGRVHLVHFKGLNSGPFRVLARLNPKRTVFFEPNCWGYSKLMIEQVGNIGRQRRRDARPVEGDTIIGFSRDWPELARAGNADKEKLVIPSSHFGLEWREFVSREADSYLDGALRDAGLATGTPVIVYILGYFGGFSFLRTPDAMRDLFEQTMDVLAEVSRHVPVVLKPHVITDRKVVADAIARRPHGRFVVADLHPMVLATRAAAFVANYYSTTFGDAHAMGVPTVEFTDYNVETLSITAGQSMRAEYVTHFINANADGLRPVMERIVSARGRTEIPLPEMSGWNSALAVFSR